MATGHLILPIGAATLPDGSAGSAAPGITRVKSSAADPKPYFLVAAFDQTTKEQLMWSCQMPADYASAPVMRVMYFTTVTTGTFAVDGRVAAVSEPDSTDIRAKAFSTTNVSSAQTVPGTAGHPNEISLTLTNADSLAANDFVVFYLARDVAADNAAADVSVFAVSVQYTTT
jgi:hypothetical protein